MHANYMTAIVAQKDPRLDSIVKAGDLRRPDRIYQGLTLSDFFVTQSGKVFVEGAYRYVSKSTDVTVRESFNSREEGLARQLGGSLAIRQKIADNWHVGLTVEKMSVKGTDSNEWSSYETVPVAAYGTLSGPGFELKAGAERGGFQASVAADLGKLVAGLGANANVSVNADGSYRVMGQITGTF